MMNRTRKIRGNKKKFRDVEHWIKQNKVLDIDYLNNYKRDYCKVRIDPWGTRISLTNSGFPEPNGKIKQDIINGLIEIYDNWKKQLDELNKPYYLKIWLYDPNFSRSQVVCAIDENIDYYTNMFHNPDDNKSLELNHFGAVKEKMNGINWDHRIEEHFVYESEFEDETDFEVLKYLRTTKKKAQRVSELNFEYKEGFKDKAYGVKVGEVWIGSR